MVSAIQEHVCTDRCDHTEVKSYATVRTYVIRWNRRENGHGPRCGCLPCLDIRARYGETSFINTHAMCGTE